MSIATIDHTSALDKTADTISKNKVDAFIENESIQQINREDLSYYYSSGNFHFILEHGFKPETLETTSLTEVPFLPDWYDGILSIHGLIIPVVDILKFAQFQNIKVEKLTKNKHYLLKLEHSDHSPIVLKLQSIPQLINTTKLDIVDIGSDSPNWIRHYLNNDDINIAVIDHDKLFEQLVANQ